MKQHFKNWQITRKRFWCLFVSICIVGYILPLAAQTNSKSVLYHIEKATENHFGMPYRATINGDIIGEIPNFQVYEVTSIEGEWAKVKFKGSEYYIKKDRLKKVDAPNMVCSHWAKDCLAYRGYYIGAASEWNGVADDWTKPITRADMAKALVGIMRSLYGDWCLRSTLPGAIKSNGGNYFSDTQDFDAGRLAYWGVVPTGKFNPTGSVSFDEMTALVVKLMAYEKKYIREGSGETFTKAHIAKFGIGGNKAPNAKCTKEQANIMCEKVVLWRQEMEFIQSVKFEDGANYDGTVNVYNGLYTIKTLLGSKPNQPNLIVNAEGKVELNKNKKQQYKVTYKKCALNKDGNVMFLYTIQTMDSKYLGISGTAMNGSRLIAQKEEFLWWIEHGSSEDGQWTNFIEDPNNYHQVVNASDWKTDNGTPIITWFWRHGTGADANNCKFIFTKVK
jgi:hypothetical protein